MNSFPILNTNLITAAFDRIKHLFHQDKVKMLEAAERATASEQFPFAKTANAIDPQLEVVRNKLIRTAHEYGQKLYVKIVEELFNGLVSTGATGVNQNDFLNAVCITLDDQSLLSFANNKQWFVSWKLEINGNERDIKIGIRNKQFPQTDIVPDYVLQYLQQATYAYKTKRHAASLALMTIALEGTLRDALQVKGYTYHFGTPSQDVYQIEDIQIHKDPAGYKVVFPSSMPLNHNHFLSATGDPLFKTYRIKRVLKGGAFYLEIRQANDLLDYWSSNTVVTHGTAQISGLGAAINISRNQAAILTPIDLPEDLDGAIQSVRNNLIHLSGNAMNEEVDFDLNGAPITLGDFLRSSNKVFDAVCTIGDTVNKIYERIAAGTL